MYSASIIRKGFTYRLELESINTSSINISSMRLLLLSMNNKITIKDIIPSMRGSLSSNYY